jgi:hypothetical protein
MGRANLDGTDVETRFIHAEGGIGELAVGGGNIYWAGEHAIGRAKLNGSDVEPNFIPITPTEGTGFLNGIAISGGYIYWSAIDSHNVGRASLNGHSVDQQFIRSPGFVLNLAIAGPYLYWQGENSFAMPTQKWISRGNLDGHGIENELVNTSSDRSVVYGALAADTLGPGGASPPEHRKPRHRPRARR